MCLGAEIDCEDKSRNTALHIAARYGHELIITALVKHGASAAKLVTTHIQPSVCAPTESNLSLANNRHANKRVFFFPASLFSVCGQKHSFTLTRSPSRPVMTCLICLSSFQKRHSWDVPSTPGSSQRLLRLLQEAAVLRYSHADAVLAIAITQLTSKLMLIAYLRRV